MEYTYKDKVFTAKTDNLKLYRLLFPLIDKYNTLKFLKLKEIDRSIIFGYQKKIALLKRDIARATERKEDSKKLTAELYKLEDEFSCDPEVIELNAYISSVQESIFRELLFDDNEMLKKMSVELVDGETEIFDYEDAEFLVFIGKVVGDFFLTMRNPRTT